MNIISMYLPQFHRVKENDEWWGEGYTEWTAVKNANKLYEKHIQPNIPLNENYYDLMQKNTMIWQVDLMKKYGINGQCFYHYWFKDGRRILENPAENLLRWKDVNMPFCFCWANETWARTWSNIREKNVWTFRFDSSEKKDDSGILLEQQYGGENDWRVHYEYLKDFFVDSRYIKYNEKPVFLIYKSRLISCLGDMLSCWNRWALEDGFNGIYVIGANTDIDTEKYLDAILNHEPQNAISKLSEKVEDGVIKYSYEELWNTLLLTENLGKKTYYGGFVGYDDTPRRGSGGIVVEGSTPQLFQKYLSMLIAKNIMNGNEYTFLNAWNEWGEGMYLEPDMNNGYSYLEAVKYACKHYTKYLESDRNQRQNYVRPLDSELNFYRKKVFQYEKYWKIFDVWMELREQEKRIDEYLRRNNIKNVGIYGAGMLGRHLFFELSESQIETVFAVDQKAEFIDFPIKVYTLNNELPVVDMIIITVVTEIDDIKDAIKKKLDCKVILLEDLIMELFKEKGKF